MRFGDLSLQEAAGAILAHALHLPGAVWRKGRVLSGEDIGILRAAGLSTVTAAKLDNSDVGEDEAAARIAAALAGPHVRVSAAYTGRVNLYATVDGVLTLDRERLEALNLLDESITIATLPAHTVVEAGRMLATVKIIPFAAPRPAVDAAVDLARGATGPVGVAGWRGLAAGLIQTFLPGTKPAVLDKTVAVTGERLQRVGAGLRAELRVAHEPAAVSAALAELRARGCSLLLLLGASAVTDRRDVLPAALAAAGGEVVHFGMPVDPGNLLLLGRLGGTPVLGLPGCARSPKLNGFDWVLERLAAGLEVTRADIMRMGIGGLLTEIATRPLPRDRATEPPRAPRIAALVLAAGLSRRMGTNKLLATVAGKPLVRWAAEAALASHATSTLIVTGHQEDAVRAALADLPVRFVPAPDHAEGLSASLKAGLAALGPDVDGAVVLLGDMPKVRAAHIDRLIAAYSPADGRSICVPVHGGRRGNPVLWDSRHFADMRTLTGDTGARSLLASHAEAVCEVEMADDGVLHDVDTPEALAHLRKVGPSDGPTGAPAPCPAAPPDPG